MRKTIFQILKFLAFLFIGLLLLWLAFRNVKFDKLVEGLKGADYKWVVISVLFGLAAYISRARRWNLLISPLGHSPALGTTFYAMMTGYLANLALPRVGEITRCVALGKKEKIPVDQLIGTVVIERTVDLASLLSIMFVLIIIRGSEINEFLRETIFIPSAGKSIFFSWIHMGDLDVNYHCTCIVTFSAFQEQEEAQEVRFLFEDV